MTREEMIEAGARAIEAADPCHVEDLAAAVIDAIGAEAMTEAIEAIAAERRVLGGNGEYTVAPALDAWQAMTRARAARAKALENFK